MTSVKNNSTKSTKRTLTRQELIDVRIKCDDDLLFFTRFFYKELRGTKFIINDHHHVICKELDRVANYAIELLNINIPPRMSKTELAINFIARGIGKNPTANYLYITASDELRAEVSVRIRDIVSHPYFVTMYGVGLKKDQNGKNLWRTIQGGGLKTATIFGQITGFGAGQMIDHHPNDDLLGYIREFEGCIVMDDINKMDDAESGNANNEKVSRVVSNTVLSRKNSKDTPLINIQQRAGEEDATAFFMEYYGYNTEDHSEKAEFLIMPVMNEKGEPLWEWKLGYEEIQKLSTNSLTAHVFETQYMQDPKPKQGRVYDLNYFNPKDVNYENAINLGSCDVADTGTDHLAAPFAKVIGNRVYIHDVLYTQDGSGKTIPEMAVRIKLHQLIDCIIEMNNQGSVFYSQLEDKVPNVTGVYSSGNKMSRIIAYSYIINKYFYFLEEGSEGYTDEYRKFIKALKKLMRTATKEDDAADSVTLLAKYLFENYGHLFIDTI